MQINKDGVLSSVDQTKYRNKHMCIYRHLIQEKVGTVETWYFSKWCQSIIFIWNKLNQVLHHTIPKINSQSIVDVQGKTINILGDNIVKYLCDIRI